MDVNQRVKIVILFAKHESVTLVRRELQRLKWKNIPTEKSIRSIFKKFEETGSVLNAPKSGRPPIDDEKKNEIAEHFKQEPQSSIRKSLSTLNCSYGTVQKVLRNDFKMFPYRIQATQLLYEEDCALRRVMCETLIQSIDADENFLSNLIFSDESTFHLNGIVNRHNCRIWGTETPTETYQRSQASEKVNVWMGLSSTRVYGPFFIEGNITAALYLDMLKSCFMPSLSRTCKRKAVFQQDGAPAHYSLIVRQFLDEAFPQRWLGRCGPYVWPARSPDLTPLDFFVWGYLKNEVYKRKPETIQQLKDFICQEAAKIDGEMCQNAIKSFHGRLKHCIDVDGYSVEYY